MIYLVFCISLLYPLNFLLAHGFIEVFTFLNLVTRFTTGLLLGGIESHAQRVLSLASSYCSQCRLKEKLR
jgi:hypothetical protein